MDFSSFGICIGHIFLILVSNASKLDCTIDFSDMDQSSMIGGLYADNGIDQTIMYAPLPKEEKKHVQEELLGLLGLHSRPRPLNQETSQAAPKYMLNLYQSFVDEEGADLKVDGDKLLARVRDGTLSGNNVTLSSMNEADEIISFPNQVNKQHPWPQHTGDRRFLFDLSTVPPDHQVIGAEFHLYKTYSWKQPWFQNFTLSVYLIARPS